MSALRRCDRCQTLNNTLVNGDHCYVCGQQWERDERAVVTDGGDGRFVVVEEPESGNPGTAGIGVRYRPDARPGERARIEQLWPDGSAEPVYVSEEVLGELIHELMGVHLEMMNGDDECLIADGGRPECTDKLCDNRAEYALWMGEQFSRVRSPDDPDLEDGDLSPYVCGDCLARYEKRHGDHGEFVPPGEKLVTDGGQCRECDSEYRCAYCGRDLDELDEVCRCGNAVGVLKR